MTNYDENERALKELFQDVHTVPNTLPPVYSCSDMIIGYDGQGHMRVMASTKIASPVVVEEGWLKRWQARLRPLTPGGENSQGLIDDWIRRWQSRRWRLEKAADSPAQGQLRQA